MRAGEQPPMELVSVAETFGILQQHRHLADYGVGATFTRHETLALIARADDALTDWGVVEGSPAADSFLLALLVKGRR